ncbi:placenta growth factor isoform X2 [Protopterus annectens]|uniref:placenta growth factor isoform X2 n=1 Tax=Protopterus annectens TaxID=7888 RepID=UPI001CFAC860|nr:placenta growth factor isoform X2 [Protopterus annectens]
METGTGPWLQLLTALWLHLSQSQQPNGVNGNSTTEVVPFEVVWRQSYCHTIEVLINIVVEYPSEVEHIFSPSCVAVQRCAGCCGDEKLQCLPKETRNITMQLLKINPLGEDEFTELDFTEHTSCECSSRKEKLKHERRRNKGRGQRKKEKQRAKVCSQCGTPSR